MPADISKVLPFLIPLVLIQYGLMIGAIISVAKKDQKELRFQNKLIWILIIVFGSIFGSIIYFILGSNDKIDHDNDENGGYNNGNFHNE